VSLRVPAALVLLLVVFVPFIASAQQTGSITGRVVDSGGGVLPGVTVEARSDLLPAPRVTTTDGNGVYRLPALQPGTYTVTFELSGMGTVTRQAEVQLAQETAVDATMDVAGITETVMVIASASLIERDSASIKSGISNEQIMSLPVGQEYRDLVKLIPAVQVTQEQTRGPSAGGSGQDNVYQFDGVNVTLPLFGTLSAEPASHDIAQVTTIRGGARAIDFDRSGGFTIDSVSKSGSSRYAGEISYQLQTSGMVADLPPGIRSRYEQDRSWLTGNIGGPVVPNRLHFYASYYRPENTRDNRANLYGELPQYRRVRNEGFGKLTFTPLNTMLLNFSYRDSERKDRSDLFEENWASTAGTGTEARLRIGIAEGSWILNQRSHVTFKLTRFANETLDRPDNIANVTPSSAIGARLDVANIATQGRLTVPSPITGLDAYNAFIAPIIEQHGYVENGVRRGGGLVGYGLQFNDQDFFRNAGQVGYNISFGTAVSHDLHVGYQRYSDREDLVRSSNGWGSITVPGSRTSVAGTPIFYTARYQQQGVGSAAPIRSSYGSQSFEINDTIRWRNWTFNAGVLASNDALYGQGLREDRSTISGFVAAPGNRYRMYEIPFSKMIQPRVGVTWAFNGRDTVYTSYARYNPAASSLPRAASWDRNLIGTFIDAHFDANGVLFAAVPVGSSSGKLFVDDLTPRTVDEFLAGTAWQLRPAWSARVYGRYREATHFWEDTNNNARIAFNAPPHIAAKGLYIPDLAEKLAQIGSGSTFVIADLDDSYTRYYEATLESDWRSARAFVRGSYTWSRYRGNFDQDNTTALDNDMNTFIGSSNIADDAGRQLWDNKDGILRGDRPHMFKVYGFYSLAWNATAGAFVFAQSGQPWEAQSYLPYVPFVGTSTSDSNRYAEPAGSRRTDPHWQMDFNYTQNIRLANRMTLQIAGDLFNAFNRQTGYNIQPSMQNSQFGLPRHYFDPRRFQLAARLRF
jgi:hypothetical protein